MSRMDWRKAGLAGKRSLSTADEKDYRDRDAAARWLEKNSTKPKAKRHKARSAKSGEAA